MSTMLEDLTVQAMKLSPTERTELMERLADSVLPASPLHPAWEAEMALRVAEMEAGITASIPAEQVLAELRGVSSEAIPRPPMKAGDARFPPVGRGRSQGFNPRPPMKAGDATHLTLDGPHRVVSIRARR